MNVEEFEKKIDDMEEFGISIEYECNTCGDKISWSFMCGIPPSELPILCKCGGKLKLLK